MNRKQWIMAGVFVIVLLVIGIIFLQNRDSGEPVETGQDVSVRALVYCSEEQVRPCVVSFSTDVDGNMLINILLPDLSFPNFHLKIMRGASEIDYNCQRVSTALNNAYCIGEKMPPGETLHLMLISTRDETLLAEGDLSIIGLALPTLEIVLLTSAPTESTAAPAPTEAPDFILPTTTPLRSPISTPSSYPNPSYPNPSYP